MIQDREVIFIWGQSIVLLKNSKGVHSGEHRERDRERA